MIARKMKTVLTLSLIFLSMFFSGLVFAESEKDIRTLSRSLGFIQGGPIGHVEMAIVYDPAIAGTEDHADKVLSAIRTTGNQNKVSLTGRKVSVSDLHNIKAKVIFITKGMERRYEAIMERAIVINAVTVSTDEDCLKKGGCVLVVKTKPDIDILVRMELAKKVGIEFSSAFMMMITNK